MHYLITYTKLISEKMDVVETINTYGIVQLFYKVVTNNHWTSQSSSPLFGQYVQNQES